MIPRLVVASKNPDKVSEIELILAESDLAGEVVRGLEWPDVEETGATLEANALLKAHAVVRAVGLPVIADDTGLEVHALDGAPGVHTGRYAGDDATYEDNVAKLLEVLGDETDRRATFRSVMALVFPDGVEIVAEGRLEGTITREPSGAFGFGYDPVFEVDGTTLSEMGVDEKNRVSHRGRAIRALVETLGL